MLNNQTEANSKYCDLKLRAAQSFAKITRLRRRKPSRLSHHTCLSYALISRSYQLHGSARISLSFISPVYANATLAPINLDSPAIHIPREIRQAIVENWSNFSFLLFLEY